MMAATFLPWLIDQALILGCLRHQLDSIPNTNNLFITTLCIVFRRLARLENFCPRTFLFLDMFRTLKRLRESWRTVANSQPLVRKATHALYWLPIAAVFTEYFYTVKLITGRSMQVCVGYNFLDFTEHLLTHRNRVALLPGSQHSIQTCLSGGTSLFSTACPFDCLGTSHEEMSFL
jgi:hypothetical protein